MSENDLDSILRERFAELRSEEQRRVPPFAHVAVIRRRTVFRYRAASIAAAILILLATAVTWGVQHQRRHAESRERAAAPFMKSPVWQAPTDVLLKTPGRDLLATVPHIGSEQAWPAVPRKSTTKGAPS